MNGIERVFLEEKAKTINHLKTQIAGNVIEIGRNLSEAREICAHGEWKKWIENNVDFNERQAGHYIQIYHKFKNVQIGTRMPISKLKLLASLPDDQITDDVIDQAESATVKELKAIINTGGGDELEKKRIAKEAYKQGADDMGGKFTEMRDKYNTVFAELSETRESIEQYKKRINELSKENRDVKDIERLKNELKELKATRNSFEKELAEIRQLVTIKNTAKKLLQEISIIQFMKQFNHKESFSPVATNIVKDIVHEFESWVRSANQMLARIK